jgi:hypothetical protein
MGLSVFPAPSAASKVRFVDTLTSGSSWSVPTGVTNVNVTCVGAGGAGGGLSSSTYTQVPDGLGGQILSRLLSVTPGGTVSYSIGAGGTGSGGSNGGAGGTTSFGSVSASGGLGGQIPAGGAGAKTGPSAQAGLISPNGGQGLQALVGSGIGGPGGAGYVIVEYWV